MPNNRITYATAQLALKDNALPSGSDVMGFYSGTLVSGTLAPAATTIILNATNFSGHWPATGTLIIEGSGSNVKEYATYSSGILGDTISGVVRGAFGTTDAIHASGAKIEIAGWQVPLGVQSVSITTNFSLEDVFTLGQLDAYENVEGTPEIEVTIEKVLDGTKPLWLLVTDADFTTLKGSTAAWEADVAVSIYPDTQSSASGIADSTVTCSGMVLSSYAISMTTDGNFTETVTLQGDDKTWTATEGVPDAVFSTSNAYDAAIIGSGVSRAEDFNVGASTLPADIIIADDSIQSIDISVDVAREDIFKLGQKASFFKSVTFPITVETTFEIVTSEGDKIEAVSTANNLTNRSIILVTDGGLTIDLGTANKVSSVDFGGYDATGGNGLLTITYQNSNSLNISHENFDAATPNRVQN